MGCYNSVLAVPRYVPLVEGGRFVADNAPQHFSLDTTASFSSYNNFCEFVRDWRLVPLGLYTLEDVTDAGDKEALRGEDLFPALQTGEALRLLFTCSRSGTRHRIDVEGLAKAGTLRVSQRRGPAGQPALLISLCGATFCQYGDFARLAVHLGFVPLGQYYLDEVESDGSGAEPVRCTDMFPSVTCAEHAVHLLFTRAGTAIQYRITIVP